MGQDPADLDAGEAWDFATQFVRSSTMPEAAKTSTLESFAHQREHALMFHDSVVVLQAVYDELDADPTNAALRARMEDQMLVWLRDGMPGDIGGRLLENMARVASHFGLRRVFTEGVVIIHDVLEPTYGRFQTVWESEARKDAAAPGSTPLGDKS